MKKVKRGKLISTYYIDITRCYYTGIEIKEFTNKIEVLGYSWLFNKDKKIKLIKPIIKVKKRRTYE